MASFAGTAKRSALVESEDAYRICSATVRCPPSAAESGLELDIALSMKLRRNSAACDQQVLLKTPEHTIRWQPDELKKVVLEVC